MSVRKRVDRKMRDGVRFLRRGKAEDDRDREEQETKRKGEKGERSPITIGS